MRSLEQRLKKIEKMHSINDSLDSEVLTEVMKSQMFGLHCLLKRMNLGRAPTSEEKLAVAVDLFKSGRWQESVVDKIVESLTAKADKTFD